MHLPKDNPEIRKVPQRSIFVNTGRYIKSLQLESGSIPSNEDGSHDPWDHIESIMGLNFADEIEASKLAFNWLIKNQNHDGSWFSKYHDEVPIEFNKPSHFGPYIAVAALHFYKTFSNKEFLETLWPSIELAINFALKLQTKNGTIPWSVDKNGEAEGDFLLTGSSSILKSIECGIAISNILNKQNNITNWSKSYDLLSQAIREPSGKFDLLKDRKRFSMDWYYPILSGCLDDDKKNFYIDKVFKDFYTKDLGIKCVIEEPWVTVAETSEFIIALVMSGRSKDAKNLLLDVLSISDENQIPYMGWQYEEKIFWPNERPSWTSAALIISADSVMNFSNASDLFLVNQSSLY